MPNSEMMDNYDEADQASTPENPKGFWYSQSEYGDYHDFPPVWVEIKDNHLIIRRPDNPRDI